MDLKKLEIKDSETIKKYLNQFTKFYIPATEYDTFDKELLDSDILHKSSEIIGQHQPIEVAINEQDKYPESSPFHIHLRIIDGRHRWKQAIKHNKVWATTFYQVSNYQQYMQLRGHFDSKKSITVREREEYFSKLARYYEEVLNKPKQKICQLMIIDFSPPFNEATIRRYCPNQYKDDTKRNGCYASVKKRHPISIREIQQKNPATIRADYSKFRHRLETLEEENEYLRSEIGRDETNRTFYVLEELHGNFWGFVHCRTDQDLAIEELNWLNPEKYRLRKVTHINEIIYKQTDDVQILKNRVQRTTKRRQYQSRKFAKTDKNTGCIVN